MHRTRNVFGHARAAGRVVVVGGVAEVEVGDHVVLGHLGTILQNLHVGRKLLASIFILKLSTNFQPTRTGAFPTTLEFTTTMSALQ
jgi:hypothetical protein